jgi:20S proteasome alpha/beta subunit
LTTVIAIKSKDGIVIASDSQGTSNTIKTKARKIYKINRFVGLGGAGDSYQIIDVVKPAKKPNSNEFSEYKTEVLLKESLAKSFGNLHKIKNVDQCANAGYYLESYFPFCPDVLILAKIKDEEDERFCFYRGGFGEIGKYKVKISDAYMINSDFETIGSGSNLAYLVLSQQTRIYSLNNNRLSELPLKICIGVALYTISEVKDIDPLSGKDTVIAVIDKDEFREIPPKEHALYYDAMIEGLSKSITDLSNNRKMKEIVKKILSVNQSSVL